MKLSTENVEKFSLNEIYENIFYILSVLMGNTNCKKMMMQYSWPGNIRELENWTEKCIVLYSMDKDIKFEKHFNRDEDLIFTNNKAISILPYNGSLKDIEKQILNKILDEESGNISRTATRLQIDRNTLKRKLS